MSRWWVEPASTPGGCWAALRRSYGARFASSWNCEKKAREGKLTCHVHDDREQAAQDTKARLDAEKRKTP